MRVLVNSAICLSLTASSPSINSVNLDGVGGGGLVLSKSISTTVVYTFSF